MQDESTSSQDVAALMDSLGRAAVGAARALARANTATKNAALGAAAAEIRKQRTAILEANRSDLQAARQHALSDAMLDRLALTKSGSRRWRPASKKLRHWPIPSVSSSPHGRAPMACASSACACRSV
jgi:hypothetical protein